MQDNSNLKNKLLILKIFLFLSFIPELHSDSFELVKYLPSQPSYCLAIKSLKTFYNNFQNSKFWKSYKLTSNGSEIQKSIDSISASFLIIGLTFNDLVEIFSDDTLLAIWVTNNYIDQFLYLINQNKKIEEFIERLEYFAIANKINYQKSNFNSGELISFEEKIFIARIKNYVIIGNNRLKVETTINNISENKGFLSFNLDNSLLKNRNIVFWNNYEFNTLYSFDLFNNLTIEAIGNISDLSTNFEFSLKPLQFIPSNVDFIAYSENLEIISERFLKNFQNFDTNFVNVDVNYFRGVINNVRKFNLSDSFFALSFKKNRTNIIVIKKESISNYNLQTNTSVRLKNYFIYSMNVNNELKYICNTGEYLLFSNDLNFLKDAILNYSEKNSFYFSNEFRKIKQKIRNENKVLSFLWFDLNKHIIEKSFKYPEEKWKYYNSYIKTFDKLLLYTFNNSPFFYSCVYTSGSK